MRWTRSGVARLITTYCTELVFCDSCSGVFHFGQERLEYRAGAETIPIGVYAPTDEIAQIREMICQSIGASTPTNSVRVDLLCGLAAAALQESLTDETDVLSKTERVKEIIDSQYVDEWDTTTLAYEVGVSPDYLRQVFRAKHGISVARYLREVRLKTAARLFETTDDPIRQIAAVSGLDDSSYFSKVFRRQFGQSPGEYRASQLLDPDPATRLDEAHPHES